MARTIELPMSVIVLLFFTCMQSSSVAVSLEDALSYVTEELVEQVNGEDWVLHEAYACPRDPSVAGPCKNQDAIATLGEAEYMHAVFVPRGKTFPFIEAEVDLTSSPPGVMLRLRQDYFLQNDHHTKGFPPPSNVTFEKAMEKLRAAVPGATACMVTWRKPLHPCVSEDLFQFMLSKDSSVEGSVVSVGTETGNVCSGYVTEASSLKMCPEPICFETPVAV